LAELWITLLVDGLALLTDPANMAAKLEMCHSGELKPMMATAW